MDMKEVELVWLLMISVFTLLFKWNSALNKLYIDADGRGGRRFTCVGRCEWGRGGGWAAGDSGCFDWMYWGLSNTSVWVAQAVAGLLFTSRYWSSVAEMLYQTYAVCFVSGVFFYLEMVFSISFSVLRNQPLPLCPVAPSLKHIIGPWISFFITAFRITFAQVYMGPFSKLKSTSCGLPLGSSCDMWGWGSVARLNLNDCAL